MAKKIYFTHERNARNSVEVRRMRMKYGSRGYAVYFMLWEMLIEEADYTYPKDYEGIAFDIQEDVDLVKSIIDDSGFFVSTENGDSFYSPRLNEYMAPLEEIRKKRAEAGKRSAESRQQKSTSVEQVLKIGQQKSTRSTNVSTKINKTQQSESNSERESESNSETINSFPKNNISKTSNSDRVNTFPSNENFAGVDDQPYEEILEVVPEGIDEPSSPESNRSSETGGVAAEPEKPKRKSVAKKKDPSEYSIVHKIRLMLEEMWTDPPIIWSSARAREAKVIADAIMAMSRAKKGVDASDDDILKGLQYVLWCAGNIPFYHDKIRNLGLIGRNIETIIIQGKGEGKFMPNGKMSTAARNQFLDDVEQEMRAQMRAGKISLDDFKLS